MAPLVLLMMVATPPLPLPPTEAEGQLIVDDEPSVHTPGALFTRNSEKFWVVPDESERRAMVMWVLGSVTPGFKAPMAGSFHVVIWAWKILAMVGPSSLRFETPDRWYDMVIGAITTGKYSTVPSKLDCWLAGMGES